MPVLVENKGTMLRGEMVNSKILMIWGFKYILINSLLNRKEKSKARLKKFTIITTTSMEVRKMEFL